MLRDWHPPSPQLQQVGGSCFSYPTGFRAQIVVSGVTQQTRSKVSSNTTTSPMPPLTSSGLTQAVKSTCSLDAHFALGGVSHASLAAAVLPLKPQASCLCQTRCCLGTAVGADWSDPAAKFVAGVGAVLGMLGLLVIIVAIWTCVRSRRRAQAAVAPETALPARGSSTPGVSLHSCMEAT